MKLLRPAIVLVILLTCAFTVLSYPQLPDVIVSHWNAAGEADGYLPKFWGLVLVLLLMVGCTVLFAVLPRIDPLRKNYEQFRDYYEGFILIFTLFLFGIQLQVILWGLGIRLTPNLTLPPLIGALFIYIGFFMEHVEPNWFVGIRTPWTLSSASVWRKTHQRGGMLFKLAGGVSVIGVLTGRYAWLFILVPVLAVAIYTVVYSYVEYFREKKGISGGDHSP